MANRPVPISPRSWLLALGLALASRLLLAFPAHAGFLDLSWNAPTTNADGSPLTDLASYRVYYGTSASPCLGSTFQTVLSSSPTGGGVVTYRLTGVQTGTTYFVQVTALDTSGNQSACSNQASGAAQIDLSVTPTGTTGTGRFLRSLLTNSLACPTPSVQTPRPRRDPPHVSFFPR